MCDMTLSYVWPDSFICATWLFHTCDMILSYVWHDSFICVTWLFDTCDMILSYVWHDSLIRVTWLFHMCDMTLSYVWHDSFICVTWLFHICNPVGGAFYLRHDSFISATWLQYMRDMFPSHTTRLFHMCHMTPSYVRCNSCRSATWFRQMYQPVGVSTMCDISSLYLWHESFICVIWPLHTCDVTPSIWHVTFVSSTRTFIYVTWLLCMFVKLDFFICATP